MGKCGDRIWNSEKYENKANSGETQEVFKKGIRGIGARWETSDGRAVGEKEVLLLFIKLFMILCSLCVYLLNVYSTVAVYHFILGLFGLRMINTINYILRDLVGFLALLYITFDYRGIIRKNSCVG